MRRYSKEELKNRKKRTIIISAVLVLLSVLWCFFPYLCPSPKYDELNEKTITIHKYVIMSSKGVKGRFIYTTDGEIYRLTGDFAKNLTDACFVPGNEVTIKWYKWLFTYCAEEVVVDGRPIVWYDNDTIVLWPYMLTSGMVWVVVAMYILFEFSCIKRIENLQAKRDKRIEKKYGKKESNI